VRGLSAIPTRGAALARVYCGGVQVSIEAVQRLRELASLPTGVKEVVTLLGKSQKQSCRRRLKAQGTADIPV